MPCCASVPVHWRRKVLPFYSALLFTVAALICEMPCALHAQALATLADVPVRLVVRARPGLKRERGRALTRAHNGRVRREIPGIGTEVIEVPRGTAAQVAADLRASGAFAFVEEDGLVSAATTINDPLFPDQWGASRVNVSTAWNTSQGAATIVAVLDTGVDAAHPE